MSPSPQSGGGRARRKRGGSGGRGQSKGPRQGEPSGETPAGADSSGASSGPSRPATDAEPNSQTGAPVGFTAPGPAASARSVPHPGPQRRPRRWLRQVDEFSAGGLVVDLAGSEPRGALIGRTDRQGRLLWSLPKGHIEVGESAEQAAVREVEEETGIAGEIVAELGTIDFWFVADGRRIHKTVRHYLLRRVGGELSDADIEVDEVAWVPLTEIRAQLAYPDERGLVDTAGRLLADTA